MAVITFNDTFNDDYFFNSDVYHTKIYNTCGYNI